MIVNINDYTSQIDDWHSRLPSKLWNEHFLSLNIPIFEKEVLDCGCGPGHYGRILTSLGARVTGYDKEERCLNSASKVTPKYVQLIKGDIEKISKLEKPFDLVLLRYVLHHLEKRDRKKALTDLFSILKNNGYIVIETSFGDQFEKHYDHIIYPRLTEVLCEIYPTKEEIYSYLTDIGYKDITEKEIYQEWQSYTSVQEAIEKSNKLVLSGEGPTAWLILSKEERLQFHAIRSKALVEMFTSGVVPRYWYSSFIIARR